MRLHRPRVLSLQRLRSHARRASPPREQPQHPQMAHKLLSPLPRRVGTCCLHSAALEQNKRHVAVTLQWEMAASASERLFTAAPRWLRCCSVHNGLQEARFSSKFGFLDFVDGRKRQLVNKLLLLETSYLLGDKPSRGRPRSVGTHCAAIAGLDLAHSLKREQERQKSALSSGVTCVLGLARLVKHYACSLSSPLLS